MTTKDKEKGKVVPVRIYGDQCLRKESVRVDKIDKEVELIIADLVETMYAKDGIGLAAPQIGKNLRIFVVDPQWFQSGERHPVVFINPEFKGTSGADTSEEGCLSLPEISADVTRADKVVIESINDKGELVRHETEGLFARAIQHEFDHLDGILFTDRISKLKQLSLRGKMKKLERLTGGDGVNTDENLKEDDEK